MSSLTKRTEHSGKSLALLLRMFSHFWCLFSGRELVILIFLSTNSR